MLFPCLDSYFLELKKLKTVKKLLKLPPKLLLEVKKNYDNLDF